MHWPSVIYTHQYLHHAPSIHGKGALHERTRQASRTHQAQGPGSHVQYAVETLRVLPLGVAVDGARPGQPGAAAQAAALPSRTPGDHHPGERQRIREELR
ncbi:hypothetical protein D3C80_1458820 [compost metagenome]